MHVPVLVGASTYDKARYCMHMLTVTSKSEPSSMSDRDKSYSDSEVAVGESFLNGFCSIVV